MKQKIFGTREKWLEARKEYLGASDAAIIMGASLWQSPLGLWLQKKGLAPDIEETEPMRWGNRLEPVVLDAFMDEEGVYCIHNSMYAMLISEDYPFIACTPDGWIDSQTQPTGLAEVKTTSRGKHADLFLQGEVPPDYWVQCQHQMAVSGLNRVILIVLIAGATMRWKEIERDEKFIQEKLLPALVLFWERLQNDDPPAADGTDASETALQLMWPIEKEGKQVALSAAAQDLDHERCELMAEIRELEKRKKEVEQAIKEEIGDAELGILPNGTQYTYKTVRRDGFTVQPTSYRKLNRREGDG